ncbi:MAG: hypothetical protein AAFR84_01395 [Pseudomonadota bacterium]
MSETRERNVIGIDVAWQVPVAQWTPREQTELVALQKELSQLAPRIEWEGGATDAGDPWIVASDPRTDEVVLHIARIGRSYAAVDETLTTVASGHSLRSVIETCLQHWRPSLGSAEMSRPMRMAQGPLAAPIPEGAPATGFEEGAGPAMAETTQAGLGVGAHRAAASDRGEDDAPDERTGSDDAGAANAAGLAGAVAAAMRLGGEPREPVVPAIEPPVEPGAEEEVAAYEVPEPDAAAAGHAPGAADLGPAEAALERAVETVVTLSAVPAATASPPDAPVAEMTRAVLSEDPLPDNVIRIDFRITKPKGGEDDMSISDLDGSAFVTFDFDPPVAQVSLVLGDPAEQGGGETFAVAPFAVPPGDDLAGALRDAVLDRFEFTDEPGIDVAFDPLGPAIFEPLAVGQGAPDGTSIVPPEFEAFFLDLATPAEDLLIFG